MLELTEFQAEVVKVIEKRGVTNVRCASKARNRRCQEDNRQLYKFRGEDTDGFPVVAYACESCRRVEMWNVGSFKGRRSFLLTQSRIFWDL